jgi:hypothetical protein
LALAVPATNAAEAGPWDEPPPTVATLLAPGVISTPAPEFGFAVAPEGRTAYVTRWSSDRAQPAIYETRWSDGAWSQARPLFGGDGLQVNPSFSADGRRMVFVSSEPHSYRFQIMEAVCEREQWGPPAPLPKLKLSGNAFDASLAPDGSVYFATPRPELWDLELQRVQPEGDGYSAPVAPAPRLNSRYDDAAPCVSPDGSMLVFASSGRPEGAGAGDLYVSFRREGGWTPARNLGPRVNTAGDEGHPRFSPDQRRLFFCRDGDVFQIATASLLAPLPELLRAWKARAPLPQGRVWARGVTLNGRVYVIGGNSGWGQGTGPLQSMLEYNPETDVWRERAAPPQRDVLAPAAVVEGRIVFLQPAAEAIGFEYDPAADRWTPRRGATPVVTPTPHNSAAAVGGRIFAARSLWAAGQPLGDLLEYDAADGRWRGRGATRFAPPGEMFAHESRLYFIGGGGELNAAAVFDPATGAWTDLPSLRIGHVEVRCVWWQGRLVAVGGHTNRGGVTLDSVEILDPGATAWRPLPPLPEPRWGVSAVVCDNRLFVIGGSADAVDGGPAATTVWEYVGEL